MYKFFVYLYFFLLSFNNLYAEILNKIEVTGNDRISTETIKVFSKINIGDDINENVLDKILKNLYTTDFFNNVSLKINNGILTISVSENFLVQNIIINGVKNKDLKEAIINQISIKEKNSYVEQKVLNDSEKISNFLKLSGYYFSNLNLSTQKNSNNTVNLIYDIDLGEKALVGKINFTGNKIYKKSTLSSVIITEENKFWKFLSKKKYLNERQINLDQRLLKNFYLNEGYYQVKISNSTANIIKDNIFLVTYNIDAGDKYFFNEVNLTLPSDYDKNNFGEIIDELNKIKNTEYSFNKIEKLLRKIDKIAETKQFEFINATFSENVVEKNKINLNFIIDESKKFYVNRINIFGNDITNENVIRNLLIIDEGDPLNEILNNKSINKIKSSGLFSQVDIKIEDTENNFKKDMSVNLVEQPTGEITAGAGYGSSGQTFAFGIKENNFSGNAIRLNSSINISQDTVKGGINFDIPNYNYSDKALKLNLSRTDNDFFDTAGYKNTLTNFTIGTGLEYRQDLFFNPLLVIEFEELETNNSASQTLKKQDGNYNNLKIDYNFLYDKRNKFFKPSDGFYSKFSQKLPLISNNYSMYNSYDFKVYQKLTENMVGSLSYHVAAINSLEDSDVRVSERIYLSSKKLRGFKRGKIGPKDNNDFIGGNYATALSLSSTLPTFLPQLDNIDFGVFIDAANLWGVDYNSDLDESKLRSSTGFALDWLTPVGPLSFVIAQPLSKSSTDIEETFRFDLGTTF